MADKMTAEDAIEYVRNGYDRHAYSGAPFAFDIQAELRALGFVVVEAPPENRIDSSILYKWQNHVHLPTDSCAECRLFRWLHAVARELAK